MKVRQRSYWVWMLLATGMLFAIFSLADVFALWRGARAYADVRALVEGNATVGVEELNAAVDTALDKANTAGRQRDMFIWLASLLEDNIVNQRLADGGAAQRKIVENFETRVLDTTWHYYMMARLYVPLYSMYSGDEDFKKTEYYYRQVLTRNPNSPEALYGLLAIYRTHGDAEENEIRAEIMERWPEAGL